MVGYQWQQSITYMVQNLWCPTLSVTLRTSLPDSWKLCYKPYIQDLYHHITAKSPQSWCRGKFYLKNFSSVTGLKSLCGKYDAMIVSKQFYFNIKVYDSCIIIFAVIVGALYFYAAYTSALVICRQAGMYSVLRWYFHTTLTAVTRTVRIITLVNV